MKDLRWISGNVVSFMAFPDCREERDPDWVMYLLLINKSRDCARRKTLQEYISGFRYANKETTKRLCDVHGASRNLKDD